MLKLTSIRHAWPENIGLVIDRPQGHRDYTFLHFITSVELRYRDQIIVTPPHTCLLFAPGTPQFYCNKTPLIHDWFHFRADKTLPNTLLFPLDTPFRPLHSDFITPIVKEMELEFLSAKPHGEALTELKIRELFLKLARAMSEEEMTAVSSDTEERFRLLRADIFSHLGSSWSVPLMASRVGLSPSRFYDVYRTLYGNAPLHDIIAARIDAAKTALTFSSQSIAEIAASLGYTNITHFMRQFRAAVGVSPGAYRRRSQGDVGSL